MADFGFGPDPDFDAEYEADCDVLDELERDLGKSYIAERVTPAKNTTFNSFQGQSFISSNNNNNNINNDDIDTPFDIDEDEEKQIELVQDDIMEDHNNNKPLKRPRSTRKRKRSIDNNNDDFMDLSNLPNAKRARTNNYGLSSYSNNNNNNNNDNNNDNDKNMYNNDEFEVYLHGRPSLNDTSIMITNDTDGERLYIYYDSQTQYDREIKKCSKDFKNNTRSLNALGLLQENKSIDELLDEVQNERLSKELVALQSDFMNIEEENDDKSLPKQSELWVDKYAPKSITELLSSEKINREVTTWVKSWDYIVFGHKYRKHQHQYNNKFVNKSRNNQKNQKNNNNKPKNMYSVRNNIPMFGHQRNKNKMLNNNISSSSSIKSKKKRPEISVLLFCGAPGTGKSTLAHIVANHCGYRPFEINASDDRSGKKLKDIIINAATMKPMFGDTRPPLIIMDEIDGAQNSNGDSKSAVDVILKIVKDAKKYYALKAKQQKKNGTASRRKGEKIVNRPIICICNNQYSRSLRPLREICGIYKFKPITTRTLCKRLLDICRAEYLHTDLKTLSYLASITNNDIRSSLHTLQFFKERSRAGTRLSTRLTVDTLTNVPIGRKDKTQNIFEVWDKILKKKRKQQQQHQVHRIQDIEIAKNEEWKEICTMMYGLNDDNKIMDGVMENYLNLGYTDPLFQITFDTAQWMMEYDELRHIINHKKQFILMGYIPFMMIGIHESCGTDTFYRLQYPSTSYKHFMIKKENMNIIQQFLYCEPDTNRSIRKVSDNEEVTFDVAQYSSILSRYIDIKSCVLELIPLLQYIIYTAKRWDNRDFNNDNRDFNNDRNRVSNKRHFVSIVNTMIECGLNYVKSDGSSTYLELKPPIHKLSRYGFKNENIKQMAEYKYMNQYIKEKIAHQIILEIMRRNEAGANKYKIRGDIIDDIKDEEEEKEDDDDNIMMNRTMTPFMSGKINKRSSRIKNKILNTPIGGGQFGAFKAKNLLTQQSRSESIQKTPAKFKNFITAHNRQSKIEKYQYPIQYKFVAGYTNAVKRKSFIKDWI